VTEQLKKMLRLDISIGNLVTIATVIVGLTAGWVQLRADQDGMKEAFGERLRELEQSEKERNRRDLNQVQILAEMRTDIRYLRETVERSLKEEP
jgi:hypothetical protein